LGSTVATQWIIIILKIRFLSSHVSQYTQIAIPISSSSSSSFKHLPSSLVQAPSPHLLTLILFFHTEIPFSLCLHRSLSGLPHSRLDLSPRHFSLISLSGALSEIGDEFHFLTLCKTLQLEKGWIAQTFCLACISATSLGYLLRRIQRCSLILRRLHYRTKQALLGDGYRR
jgi:hypothetical protein